MFGNNLPLVDAKHPLASLFIQSQKDDGAALVLADALDEGGHPVWASVIRRSMNPVNRKLQYNQGSLYKDRGALFGEKEYKQPDGTFVYERTRGFAAGYVDPEQITGDNIHHSFALTNGWHNYRSFPAIRIYHGDREFVAPVTRDEMKDFWKQYRPKKNRVVERSRDFKQLTDVKDPAVQLARKEPMEPDWGDRLRQRMGEDLRLAKVPAGDLGPRKKFSDLGVKDRDPAPDLSQFPEGTSELYAQAKSGDTMSALVLADLLDEQGHPDLANRIRSLGGRGIKPALTNANNHWLSHIVSGISAKYQEARDAGEKANVFHGFSLLDHVTGNRPFPKNFTLANVDDEANESDAEGYQISNDDSGEHKTYVLGHWHPNPSDRPVFSLGYVNNRRGENRLRFGNNARNNFQFPDYASAKSWMTDSIAHEHENNRPVAKKMLQKLDKELDRRWGPKPVQLARPVWFDGVAGWISPEGEHFPNQGNDLHEDTILNLGPKGLEDAYDKGWMHVAPEGIYGGKLIGHNENLKYTSSQLSTFKKLAQRFSGAESSTKQNGKRVSKELKLAKFPLPEEAYKAPTLTDAQVTQIEDTYALKPKERLIRNVHPETGEISTRVDDLIPWLNTVTKKAIGPKDLARILKDKSVDSKVKFFHLADHATASAHEFLAASGVSGKDWYEESGKALDTGAKKLFQNLFPGIKWTEGHGKLFKKLLALTSYNTKPVANVNNAVNALIAGYKANRDRPFESIPVSNFEALKELEGLPPPGTDINARLAWQKQYGSNAPAYMSAPVRINDQGEVVGVETVSDGVRWIKPGYTKANTKVGRVPLVDEAGNLRPKGWGTLKPEGLQKLQRLIQRFGHDYDKTAQFLDTVMTPKQIKELSGESVKGGKEPVPGSFIFGPKFGAFYRNLNGDESHVTQDKWFSRLMGRLGGDVQEIPPNPSTRQLWDRVARAVAERVGVSPASLQAILWYYEQNLYRLLGANTPSEDFVQGIKEALSRRKLKLARDIPGAEVPQVEKTTYGTLRSSFNVGSRTFKTYLDHDPKSNKATFSFAEPQNEDAFAPAGTKTAQGLVEAPQILGKATSHMIHMVKQAKPDELYFDTVHPKLAKLYRHLAPQLAEHLPDYEMLPEETSDKVYGKATGFRFKRKKPVQLARPKRSANGWIAPDGTHSREAPEDLGPDHMKVRGYADILHGHKESRTYTQAQLQTFKKLARKKGYPRVAISLHVKGEPKTRYLKLAKTRAPSGGMVVNNQFYVGGKFLPRAFQSIRSVRNRKLKGAIKTQEPVAQFARDDAEFTVDGWIGPDGEHIVNGEDSHETAAAKYLRSHGYDGTLLHPGDEMHANEFMHVASGDDGGLWGHHPQYNYTPQQIRKLISLAREHGFSDVGVSARVNGKHGTRTLKLAKLQDPTEFELLRQVIESRDMGQAWILRDYLEERGRPVPTYAMRGVKWHDDLAPKGTKGGTGVTPTWYTIHQYPDGSELHYQPYRLWGPKGNQSRYGGGGSEVRARHLDADRLMNFHGGRFTISTPVAPGDPSGQRWTFKHLEVPLRPKESDALHELYGESKLKARENLEENQAPPRIHHSLRDPQERHLYMSRAYHTSTSEDLWDAFAAKPHDEMARMVLADHEDENGRPGIAGLLRASKYDGTFPVVKPEDRKLHGSGRTQTTGSHPHITQVWNFNLPRTQWRMGSHGFEAHYPSSQEALKAYDVLVPELSAKDS